MKKVWKASKRALAFVMALVLTVSGLSLSGLEQVEVFGYTNVDLNTIKSAYTVSGGVEGTDYEWKTSQYSTSFYQLHIMTSTAVTVTDQGNHDYGKGSYCNFNIVIDEGVTANLTLNNVKIILDDGVYTNQSVACVDVLQNATLNLTLTGTNEMRPYYRFPSINLRTNSNLVIDGTGSLTASSEDGSAVIGQALRISPKQVFKSITINGGTLNLTSKGSYESEDYYAGAVIGSTRGAKEDFSGSTITINGGTVNATLTGGTVAAIGGGTSFTGKITINGGTVNATANLNGLDFKGGTNAIGKWVTTPYPNQAPVEINGGNVNTCVNYYDYIHKTNNKPTYEGSAVMPAYPATSNGVNIYRTKLSQSTAKTGALSQLVYLYNGELVTKSYSDTSFADGNCYVWLPEGALVISATIAGSKYVTDSTDTVKSDGNSSVSLHTQATGSQYNVSYTVNGVADDSKKAEVSYINLTGTSCTAGSYVYFKVNPTEGYTLQNVSVAGCTVDSLGGNVYRFKMPDKDAVIALNVFVPTTGITLTTTDFKVGENSLVASVAPSNSTNQTITWSVADAGTTGATVNGSTLTIANPGTLTLKATITNGKTSTSDFEETFPIQVKADPTISTEDTYEVVYGNPLTVDAGVTYGAASVNGDVVLAKDAAGNNVLATGTAQDGKVTLTYATSAQGLTVGENTLYLIYKGSDLYNSVSKEIKVTLQQKEITADLTFANKIYDGTTAITISAAYLTGLISGDTVNLNYSAVTASAEKAEAGEHAVVYSGTFALTGEDASYYSFKETDAKIAISPCTLQASFVTQLGEEYKFTGNEITPEAVLKYQGMTLVKGQDYTESFSNNTEVGTATVTYTGIGNYSGTVTKTFEIGNLERPVNYISGTLGENSWYVTDVVVGAEGYQVAEVTDSSLNGMKWQDSLTYSEDGTYTKQYRFKNADGQITDIVTICFSIDQTKPVIATGSDWNLLPESFGAAKYDKEDLNLEAAASDATSGDAVCYYYLDKDATEVLSKDELDQLDFSATPSVTEEGTYALYAYAVDAAGNRSGYYTTGLIILDKTVPEIADLECKQVTYAGASFAFTTSEDTDTYYLIVASNNADKTAEDVIEAGTKVALVTGENAIAVNGLREKTGYTLLLVSVDAAGNLSEVTALAFTTQSAPVVEDKTEEAVEPTDVVEEAEPEILPEANSLTQNNEGNQAGRRTAAQENGEEQTDAEENSETPLTGPESEKSDASNESTEESETSIESEEVPKAASRSKSRNWIPFASVGAALLAGLAVILAALKKKRHS